MSDFEAKTEAANNVASSADAVTVNEPACATCGVAFAQHMGVVGTCAKLQSARAALESISRMDSLCAHERSRAAARIGLEASE